jgi:hypothetical protein
MAARPLFIPVILGTPRQGRMSEHVARFVLEEIAKRDGIEPTKKSTPALDAEKWGRGEFSKVPGRAPAPSLHSQHHAKHHTSCGI